MLQQEVNKINATLKFLKREINAAADDPQDKFKMQMMLFLVSAKQEMKEVNSLLEEMNAAVKKALEYIGEMSASAEEIFTIFNDFALQIQVHFPSCPISLDCAVS